MAEENTSQGLNKSRTVLGDLTNRIAKRRISEKEKNGTKSFDINDKNVVKRMRISPRPCTEINSLKGNVISSISKVPIENRDPVNIETDSDDGHCLKGKNIVSCNSEFDGGDEDILKKSAIEGISVKENVVDIDRGNSLQYVNIEANDELGESLPKALSETGEAKTRVEDTQNDIDNYKKGVDDCNIDSFVLSQLGSVDCTILPESQESRAFEPDRSTGLKNGDECAHMSGGNDSINTCSCSFCTKAGYIWLDLNYQDIKARVTAMKKSQKEASILAERNCRSKGTEKHGAQLESHLMHQWRSLFQRMSSIWEEEANQLEASLLPLIDLREKCKTNMDSMNTMPPDKHEGSSRDL